ncbi:MAG: outer membrane lipoprotein-sorting protein [Sulfurimonas sp.]|uniref:outer membrane lipoprotein-sorting protein n=1 Tax=Sulfurimonas sp. TaxID=2022749 RepID=UPI0026207E80|nr:outer membrane lipoprotein-sorting protein [Sulfurimonas sp.]MDD5399664.1 outer membrane lipoprotein-sorting protein [Sulfurimonas sp.]
MGKIFLSIFLFSTYLVADEAHEIIKKLDENFRGKSIYMQLNMKIVSMGHERVMKVQSYSQGTKKSFVKIIYPPKDEGITFLSLDKEMWQYVPKIERVIKIPPSMMLQKWMGSDITNDDMVKQSSMVEDYEPKIIKREGSVVTIELIPKENAPVVWGKIITNIDTATYTSHKDIFYDEEGKEVRFFIYEKVKKVGSYFIPTYWRVEASDAKGRYTEMVIEEVEYDTKISDEYFTKSALKRFSK